MENFNLPDRVRGWLYVFTIFFTPTLTYLQETGKIGTAGFTLGMAYLTGIAILARLNTPKGGN